MTDARIGRSASEMLADPAVLAPALPKVSGEPRSTITAAREIRRQWPDIVGRKLEADAERIVATMQARLREDRWDNCSWSDVCDAARALCDPKLSLWQDRRFAQVQDMLLGEVRLAESPLFIETMIRIYIETWARKSHLTRTLSHELSKVWQQAAPDYGPLVEHYRLFDVERIVGNLLVRMSEAPNPYEALQDIRIAAPHGPGLMQVVHRSFVERMRIRLSRQDARSRDFETLLDWLHPAGQVRMAAGAGMAIAALLEPWTERQPPPDLKSLIERRLVESFGDPRVAKAGAWAECERASPPAYRLMLRWLTGASLRTFFKIIDMVAGSPMWADRAKFWLERYEKELVTEALFALSADGVRIAHQFAARNPNETPLRYGQNRSYSSTDRDKCLLIIKDSGLWVVEGSHNFKVHIYSKTATEPVKPYEFSYDCNAIRRSQRDTENVEAIVHTPNSWQRKVGRKIREWSK